MISIVSATLLVSLRPDLSIRQSYVLTTLVFLLVTTVARFVYFAILYPKYLTPLRHIPTPPDHERSWIRGNCNFYHLGFPFDEARKWVKTVPNTGFIRYYAISNIERLLVTSPKALSEILVTKCYNFVRPEVARLQLAVVAGNGLLVAEGEEHKAQRKSLNPSFTYRHIKDLYPVFWSKALELVQVIENDLPAHDGTVQIRTYAVRALMDVIGVAGMDHDIGALKDPDNELRRRYESLFLIPTIYHRFIALMALYVPGFRWLFKIPTQHKRQVAENIKYIRSAANKIVQERKAQLQNGKSSGIDIVSVALRSGTFTDKNMVDQIMTFLAAGHETTSSALQWSIYALCKYPKVQERLREEIRTCLSDYDASIPVTASVIDSLPYLNAFMNEVLRYWPPVPVVSRQAVRDVVIAGHPIPKGTVINLAAEVTNRDPNFWGPDAEEFKVERWLTSNGTANNNGGASSNYAYLTFLHGPRSCIGEKFARGELACIVAALVRRFRMRLIDENKKLETRTTITKAPLDGVMAKFEVISEH